MYFTRRNFRGAELWMRHHFHNNSPIMTSFTVTLQLTVTLLANSNSPLIQTPTDLEQIFWICFLFLKDKALNFNILDGFWQKQPGRMKKNFAKFRKFYENKKSEKNRVSETKSEFFGLSSHCLNDFKELCKV